MRILTFILLLMTVDICAQSEKNVFSENIADCYGSVAILNPGTFSFEFTGGSGDIKDLSAYPSLKKLEERNSIWCNFIAPYDGRFTMDAKISKGKVQMIVFQNDEIDPCEGLYKGSTEIKRMIQESTNSKIGLSLVINENNLYPLDLKKGQKIIIFFNTSGKEQSILDFTVKFEGVNDGGNESGDEISVPAKQVDNKKNISQSAIKVMVRDAETGHPVIANLNILGLKGQEALYLCSEFLLPVEKNAKVSIHCDAPGYFFTDRVEPVTKGTLHEVVIWMQPLRKGKSFSIEEVEFQAGTSELMQSSDAKLRRLKDFLALNSGISIEIQGHVNATGENTYAAQKLSEARAKRVMNYLIDNGISKHRLTHKGYGNTVPIYEKPRFDYEEQANRRVEILVL